MNKKLKTIQAIWVICVVLALALKYFDQNFWGATIILLGISCIATALIIGPSDLLFYTTVYVFLQYVFKPYALYNELTYDNTATELSFLWDKVLLFQFLAYAIYVYFYCFARMFKSKNTITIDNLPSIKFLTFSLFCVWISRFILIVTGGLDSIFGKVSDLSPILLCGLLIYIYKLKHKKVEIFSLFLLVLILEFTWCLITKTKLPLMIDFLAILFTRAALIKKPLRLSFLIVIPLIAIMFLGSLQIYRDPGKYGGMNWIEAGFANLTERSDTFNTATRVFYFTPESIPYWGSKMIYTLIETTLLPFPVPGKSYFPVGSIVSSLYYGYQDVYKGLGLATSWYVTVGYNWSIIIMGVMGLIVGVIVNLLNRNNWWSFGFLMILIINFSYIERSYFDIINQTTKTSLIFGVFYFVWLIMSKSRKNNKNERYNLIIAKNIKFVENRNP